MSPAARAEMEAWLAADNRHLGAYMRARAALYAMEDGLIKGRSEAADQAPARAPPLPAASRQRGVSQWRGWALAGGAALAACAALLLVIRMPVLQEARHANAVTAGNVLTLEDGSVAELDPNAKIAIALSSDARRITLLSGQATFKVAHDKARPFIVQSGGIYAQATGTVYSVARAGETGGTVKVTEGSVLVWPHEEREHAVLLHAGGEVTLDPGPAFPPPAPPPGPETLSLDNVPIQNAALRFNRVNATQIVIADPAIGATRIVGVFQLDDPESFARAAAAISGGQVVRSPGKLVIKMR